MILVFTFILIYITILIITLLLSVLSIRIERMNISNYSKEKLLKDYEFHIELKLLNKIKILDIIINKAFIEKMQLKDKFNNINLSQLRKDIPNKKEIKNIIKKLNIDISQLNLNIDIGTEDVIITSAIVAMLSAIIGIVLAQVIKKYDKEKYSYTIIPLYINKNVIKISLSCIIQIKIVHIIYIIYVLFKKRRVYKYERSSNRRSYDYGYE